MKTGHGAALENELYEGMGKDVRTHLTYMVMLSTLQRNL
jgi:hypothetical protein